MRRGVSRLNENLRENSRNVRISTERELSRATTYGLLSRLYDAPPSSELLRNLNELGFLEFDESKGNYTVDGELFDRERLEVEFTRLFLGPGQHVSPFASVYRKDDARRGELWGYTTGEIKRFMEHYGLSLNNPGAIPDHIAILFEFMERVIRAKLELCTSAVVVTDREATIQQAEQVERTFFNSYLGEWTGELLDALEKATSEAFYRTLVKHTRRFLADEREYLRTSRQ